MLVGLIINSIIDILNKRLAIFFPQDAIILLFTINTLLGFTIITLLFTFIFKTLPDGKIALLDCIVGASFTAFLFMIGKSAISFYLGSYDIASVYGAAGSIILIFAWVYYSAIILYFGAEFTSVYAQTYGHKIIPNEYSLQSKKSIIESNGSLNQQNPQ
jgi:membrane protein